jgi:uncharacterized protein
MTEIVEQAMDLTERIQQDLVQAIKAKESLRVGALRMLLAALKNKQIEKKAPLSHEEGIQVLKTQAKQRGEAIELFEKGGRSDLAEKERRERVYIEAYMPEPVSAEEMDKIIAAVISEVNAQGPKDIGAVMKKSMTRLQATGRTVDGKAVNTLVRAKLQALAHEGDPR